MACATRPIPTPDRSVLDTERDQLLLKVRNLNTYFFLDEGTLRAVDGADFATRWGHTLGVVGDSGCGKWVTAQPILRIVPPPGRIVDGSGV